jgi:predicted HTH domain antitoxin
MPALLKVQLESIGDTDYYESESQFVAEAIHTLLAARKDLRIAVTCKLYEHGAISLGKAAELSGLGIETMKTVLHERDIPRTDFESLAEIADVAEEALHVAERA